MNWAALSPKLAGAGYCVYALDYGQTDASAGFSDALGEIGASAGTLSGYVDKVLAATGSHKVDIVGHSQGGMMPNYYVKRLGGAAKVDKLVGLAPSNHGTTSEGLTALASAIGDPGLVSTYHNLAQHPDLAAFGEQAADSPFQKSLWADGDTVPGVHYAVVETSHDEVVTPYTNAFLHGGDVTNILIQNQCPDDPVGHIGIAFDGPALQDVLNILGPDNPGFHPTCTDYGATL
jgi:pimeloyl-ACP methyl ester carboxylesterase